MTYPSLIHAVLVRSCVIHDNVLFSLFLFHECLESMAVAATTRVV